MCILSTRMGDSFRNYELGMLRICWTMYWPKLSYESWTMIGWSRKVWRALLTFRMFSSWLMLWATLMKTPKHQLKSLITRKRTTETRASLAPRSSYSAPSEPSAFKLSLKSFPSFKMGHGKGFQERRSSERTSTQRVRMHLMTSSVWEWVSIGAKLHYWRMFMCQM